MATKEVFVCDTCGKGFDTQMALLGHEGFHKNLGRYKCELCALEDGLEVFFTLPQGLGAHMRAKHGVIGTGGKAERKRREAKATRDLHPPIVVDPELIDLHEQAIDPPNKNGSGAVSEAIRAAFTPLVDQYLRLQQRQAELISEQEWVERDLNDLWTVLEGREEALTPPPVRGVQVAFQRTVSDSLGQRGESWLANRRTAFTVADLARGIACGHSTAANLVNLLRDQGRVRLVGKNRQANAYVSTVDG